MSFGGSFLFYCPNKSMRFLLVLVYQWCTGCIDSTLKWVFSTTFGINWQTYNWLSSSLYCKDHLRSSRNLRKSLARFWKTVHTAYRDGETKYMLLNIYLVIWALEAASCFTVLINRGDLFFCWYINDVLGALTYKTTGFRKCIQI